MNKKEMRKERLDRGIKARTEGLYAIQSWREILYLIAPRASLIIGLLIFTFNITKSLLAKGFGFSRGLCTACYFI